MYLHLAGCSSRIMRGISSSTEQQAALLHSFGPLLSKNQIKSFWYLVLVLVSVLGSYPGTILTNVIIRL